MEPEHDTISADLSDRERILLALDGGVVRRHAELTRTGARDAAIARMVDRGEIQRLGRGLYQLPDADVDRHTRCSQRHARFRGG